MSDHPSLPAHPAAMPAAPPEALGFDPAALADAVGFALAHPTPWPRDIRAHIEAGFFEATAGQRHPRPGAAARRAERAGAAARPAGGAMGRHAAGRHDLQRGEILPGDPRRAGGGGRADPRPRRAGPRPGRRWRLRLGAECRHHLAAPADQHLRMGGHAVRQVRPDRPRPQPGGGREGAEGPGRGRCTRPAVIGNTTTSG